MRDENKKRTLLLLEARQRGLFNLFAKRLKQKHAKLPNTQLAEWKPELRKKYELHKNDIVRLL
eukprot:12655158-Prorocentrum_lima.AAC.1